MALRSSLSDVLAAARKRSSAHLLLDYLVLSGAVILAGAVIILLAGTEALSWLWLVLVSVVSLAAGLYLARQRFPSLYLVAQWIDARLKLADTLSTAAFFLELPGNADATVLENQRRQAEHLAESVDLKQALPLTRPRAFYSALVLASAVAGIFLLRYAVLGSFDPKTPLVQTALESLLKPAQQQAKANGSREDGNTPGDGREEKKEAEKNSDYAGEPPSLPAPTPGGNPKDPNSPQASDKDKTMGSKDKSDSPSGDEQSKDKQDEQGDKSDKQDGKENAKANQDASMMDKVREALKDMLNKMKSSPSESAKNQKGDQQSENEQQSGSDGQAQEKSDSQQSKNGKQASDAQDGANAQSKPSSEQQNGIGSQEGDKATKQAEALKAMGKITELLGKRAENVKGAVMVEVGTTKQQLKTQVSQSQASHGEAGSEIHRDEVPPIYEEFVQQYFEQIRKNSSSPRSDAPKTTK